LPHTEYPRAYSIWGESDRFVAMVRVALLAFLFLLGLQVSAGDLRKVMKAYEKGDWAKTEEVIRKALATQSIHPGARYYYSLLFLKPDFHKANLDSARVYIRMSLLDMDRAPAEIKDEFFNEGLTTDTLNALLHHIAVLWYAQAHRQMTIEPLNVFIDLFPESPYLSAATHTRDSLAFGHASATMSVSGWQSFLDAYPGSVFSGQAQLKRDSLQLRDFTKTNSVTDLEQFVQQNPTSAYLSESLWHLLKIRTISGDPADYIRFIEAYARHAVGQVAINRLYHIDRETQFSQLSAYVDYHLQSDSLLAGVKQTTTRYFPVFDDGYKMLGHEQAPVALVFDELPEDVRCEGWVADLIGGSVKDASFLVSKSGKRIAEGHLVRELGVGLLLIEREGEKHIVHKTGGDILLNVEDAEILNGRLLKAKKDKWGLYSLMGLPLTEYRFDAIFTDGNFWFFQRDGLLATATFDQIVGSFPKGLFLEFKFEEYELITADLLVGFREDRECLLRSNGTFEVPWGQQHIYPGDSVGYIRDDRGYALYGTRQYEYFPYLEANEGFVLRKESSNSWRLISNAHKWERSFTDSLKLLSPYAAFLAGEKPALLFQNQTEFPLTATDVPSIFTPTAPFVLITGTMKTVLNADGKKLFSGNFDALRLEGDSLFVVTFRGKHGLMDKAGREIIPMQFDYIDFADGLVSFLKKGKIGGYDLRRSVFFEAQYESKPERIGPYYLFTKGGKKGLLSADQKVMLPFVYDAVYPWTEREVWAQQNEQFFLLNIETGETTLEATFWESLVEDGSLVKYYGTAGFGVLSSRSGVLLSPEFTAIRLMGTGADAILVAEQTLKWAGFHVLTYYTLAGIKIYSHAYRPEDYEKVLCDD